MTTIREALFAVYSLSMLIVCIYGSSADTGFRGELLARMHALEDQGHGQTDKIQQMEMRLADQQERLVHQETTINKYKQRVEVLERAVEKLRHRQEEGLSEVYGEPKVSDQSQNSRETQDDTVGRETDLRIQQRTSNTLGSKETAKQRRIVVGDSGPVAFHAVIKKAVEVSHIGSGQNIVFPDVMLNLGGGYHNLHGVFIAPQPGIYLFSTSIMSYINAHPEIAVHLMKNGQILANVFAHGNLGREDQGSVTVVTQLVAGDEVWVSLGGPADTSLYGEYYDSFTGCLITPV